MASLNEIVYSIWEKIRPELADDDSIDFRLIQDAVHTQRALLLRNEYNRNRTIDPFVIQDLGCVELEVVDRAECCDITIGCSIIRTSQKIPSLIELHNESLMWVNPVDKLEKSFSFISYERAKFISGHRFTSRQIYAFVLNNYIYLISEDDALVPLVLTTIVLGFLISYIKARSESLGIECNGGFAERTERLIIVLTTTGFAGLGVPYIMGIGFWVLAIASLITVLQRLRIVYKGAQ